MMHANGPNGQEGPQHRQPALKASLPEQGFLAKEDREIANKRRRDARAARGATTCW